MTSDIEHRDKAVAKILKSWDYLKQTTKGATSQKKNPDGTFVSETSKWGLAENLKEEAIAELALIGQIPIQQPAKLGVCKLYAAAGSITQFGLNYDCMPLYAADFLGYNVWGQIEGQDIGQLGTWNTYGKPLDLAVCPWPKGSGGTLVQGAAGAFDSHYTILANVLGGLSIPIIIRFAWESTANWMEWDCGKDAMMAQNYAAYFARVAAILKAKPNVKMCWCPTWGGQNVIDPRKSYPGDDAVDYIASDVYDHNGLEGMFWDSNFQYSGAWFANFAKERGKPFCVTEWGLQNRDRPAFIDYMHDGINTYCGGGYHIYSDYSASDGNHLLSSFPLSAQRFRELF